MNTFLLLLLTGLASATNKEAYAPAEFVPIQPYSIQPRQDVVVSPENQRTFFPFTSDENDDQKEGQIVQTGDWYKVDPAPRGLFSLTEGQVTAAKVLVGAIFIFGLVYLLLSHFNLLARLRTNPEVADLIAAIEKKIPKEARSLENLTELAEYAFNSIDKYAK